MRDLRGVEQNMRIQLHPLLNTYMWLIAFHTYYSKPLLALIKSLIQLLVQGYITLWLITD